MTLPNKLTLGRIMAIPAMVVIASIPYLNNHIAFAGVSIANLINFIIFVLASITDFFDGMIARKENLVTTFGKFADPLADKMLVLTSFLILLTQGASRNGYELVPMWCVAVILVRELTVSGVRLVAAQRGEVIAAGWSGKIKTAVTMVTLGFLFFSELAPAIFWIGLVLLYVSVALTVYSGAVYIWNSRHMLFESV